jgi:uncharacterized coiled-coil DUF342 family protein
LEDNSVPNTMSLGWNDLVHLKRKLSTSLRQITENIIDIDTNKLPKANHQIHEEKTFLNSLLTKSRHIHSDIQFANEELLGLSGKVSQSKNFLSVMQNRLPDEREDSLLQRAKDNESLIHAGKYDNTREKDQILSVIRDASMKLEAIKAFRIIKDQLLQLEIQSERTKKSLLMLDDESKSLQQEIHRCKKKIQTSYDSKHRIIEERSRCLSEYNEISLQLKKLNTQMDTAADQKRRRKAQVPPDYDESIYKVKESAKKKMQDGAKLTLEELRLIYDENSF